MRGESIDESVKRTGLKHCLRITNQISKNIGSQGGKNFKFLAIWSSSNPGKLKDGEVQATFHNFSRYCPTLLAIRSE